MDYRGLPRFNILCIDMVSFYASVEASLRALDPRKVMLAVTGDIERRGSIILAASPTLKRRYGIKTGNRLYELPSDDNIHVVQARMSTYIEFSMMVTKILYQFVPMEAVSVYSIDEAFVNLQGTERLYGTPIQAARRIQEAIELQLGLPSSVGLGDNKLLAKLALDYGKRQGFFELRYEDVSRVIWPLPVEEIWGIGSRLKVRLNRMGIYKLGDLANYSLPKLKKSFGQMGVQLFHHAWGVDLSPTLVDPREEARKGFSSGITLMRDYSPEEVPVVVYELADKLAAKLRSFCFMANTISLSIGYSRDEYKRGYSRSVTLLEPTNVSRYIWRACMDLMATGPSRSLVRHIHVGVSNLLPDNVQQLELFPDPGKEQLTKLGRAIDGIQNRFGAGAILRASALTEAGTAVQSSHKIGGHTE